MQAKQLFFNHVGKIWKCLLIEKIPCPNGLEASFLNSATSMWEVLPRWNLWWKHYASTGSFAPTSNDFRWFLHGIVFLGKSDWFPFCQFFWYVQAQQHAFSVTSNWCSRTSTTCASVAIFYERNMKLVLAHVNSTRKRSNIFDQRNIKLMLAHVNNMCKCSSIFYERNIKLVLAHDNSMRTRSNIFYERNIKFMFVHVNNICKPNNIFLFPVACRRRLLAPPHPNPCLT